MIWRFDYYARGAYRRKYIEVKECTTIEEARDKAIKKSRLGKSIVDLCIVEHVGQ